MAAPTQEGVFTEQEYETLIRACLGGPGVAALTDAQILAFVRWAENVRVRAVILREILQGKVLVKPGPDGEWAYAGEKGVGDAREVTRTEH